MKSEAARSKAVRESIYRHCIDAVSSLNAAGLVLDLACDEASDAGAARLELALSVRRDRVAAQRLNLVRLIKRERLRPDDEHG